MAYSLNLQLIQDVNGNFVIYDDTPNTASPTNYIGYKVADQALAYLNNAGAYIEFKIKKDTDPITNWTTYIIADTLHTAGDYHFDFGTITRSDFIVILSGFDASEQGIYNVAYTVHYYTGSTIAATTTITYNEMAFKATEIYRAKWFEKFARNATSYSGIEYRYLQPLEIEMLSLLVFDSYFKAMKAAIQVGNKVTSVNILDWLVNYQSLNPITP